MESELHRRVRERARLIWEDEGRPEGRAGDHWRRAEAEIAEEEIRARTEDPVPGAPGAAEGTTGPERARPPGAPGMAVGAKVTGDGRRPSTGPAPPRRGG